MDSGFVVLLQPIDWLESDLEEGQQERRKAGSWAKPISPYPHVFQASRGLFPWSIKLRSHFQGTRVPLPRVPQRPSNIWGRRRNGAIQRYNQGLINILIAVAAPWRLGLDTRTHIQSGSED